MNISGAGTVASLIARLFSGDGSVIKNAESAEGRELLISNGNVVSLLGNMIVEPRFIVPRTLQNHAMLNKVLDRQMSTFVGIYTMAFKHIVENLGFDASVGLRLLSTNQKNLARDISNATVESFTSDLKDFNLDDLTTENKKSNGGEDFNLFRKVEISLKSNGDEIKINVIVKASMSFVNVGNIEMLLEDNNPDINGFWARLDDVKSGAISWSEFWFPTDLIAKSRKRRLMDSDDLIKDMREMSEDAYIKTVTEGAVGFGKNYRFLILSGNDKARIENILRKKFVKGGAQKLIDAINLMGLSVLNDDTDIVTTFINSTSGELTQTYKSMSKDGDSNTDDILAYLAGMR